jgi:hypothetical protein
MSTATPPANSEVVGDVDQPTPPSETVRVRRSVDRKTVLQLVVPIAVYLVLVLLGITNSNIGIGSLREDPAHPDGLQIGSSKAIRSDEYATASPMWLGQIARDGAEAVEPLSVSGDLFLQLPTGIVSDIVFFDGTALGLGHFIPAEMLFAMRWWLPTLLLFLGLPFWFRQVTGSSRWGYLAAALIFVAPGNAWWSGLAVNMMGFVAAGCALANYATHAVGRGRYVRAALAFVAAGILLARVPTTYQPLAIVVALPFVVSTAIYILTRSMSLRRRIISLAAITLAGLAWTAALFWENRDAVAIGLATVYPGARQSSGESLSLGFIFGATNLGGLSRLGVAGSNQSEISTSFVLLAGVGLVLIVFGGWRAGRHQMWIFLPMVIGVAAWMSWSMITWGPWSGQIPLVNRVPASRAALGVGFLATIGFCMFMAQYRPRGRTKVYAPVVAGAVGGGLSLLGGWRLRSDGTLPGLQVWFVLLAAAVTAVVVFAIVRWPGRWWSMTVAGAAALSLTFTTGPILVGLGDLRTSDTAQKFLSWGAKSRDDGTVWASDSTYVDALMMATGTPSLSSRQMIGPDAAAWKKLDPGGKHEDMWNRGGTHITFDWTDSGVRFSLPFGDQVTISGSPCAVAQRFPTLRHIVSSHRISASCVKEIDRVEWSGQPQYVYAVDVSPRG